MELAFNFEYLYLRNGDAILQRWRKMVRPAGLEPAASRLEVSRSIQMSYGRVIGMRFSGLFTGCKP